MKHLLLISTILIVFIHNTYATTRSQAIKDLYITPINHATFLLDWNGRNILVDPVADFEAYKKITYPEIILLTDIHPDHLDLNCIKKLSTDKTTIIAPASVFEQIKKVKYKNLIQLANDQSRVIDKIKITAVPMYNMETEKQKFHPKGRGNGYLLELNKKKVYISGDTEDTPEMRALKNIDVAFICMNLPYTMSVDRAIQGTLAFAPKEVYPFHYRGKKDGQPFFHDVKKFKSEVEEKNSKIKVRLLDWY